MTSSQSTPVLERRYPTSWGTGAEFRMPSGLLVTLEPEGALVAVGWTVPDVRSVAPQLNGLAEGATRVLIARDHELAVLDDPGLLGRALRDSEDIEMVRIESRGTVVIWAVAASPAGNELSVVAQSWNEAALMASVLGAHDVAAAIRELVEKVDSL